MSKSLVLTAAAAMLLSLPIACAKSATDVATDTRTATSNVADATADSVATATDAGGAVSPPEANGAINTDTNKGSMDTVAASTSFTEDQAKGHIENAGYTHVSNLMKTADGLWTAKATKAGRTVNVAVDFKGAVSAK